MHRLIMQHFGPIESCDIEVGDFQVFMGAQASGKSTIAKAIFFFRTIKDDIFEVMMKRGTFSDNTYSLRNTVNRHLHNKFMQLFGSSRGMRKSMELTYVYNDDSKITISLSPSKDIYVKYSSNLLGYFKQNENSAIFTDGDKNFIKKELNELFSDDYETIFIPAGRSLITLLTTQLNYIYSSMNDDQKSSLDYCTQKYVERILKIRGSFGEGISGYLDWKKKTSLVPFDAGKARRAIQIIDKILKGKYVFTANEERLVLDSGRYVKINFTSSGQQETVWIFNILAYQLINNTKTFLILEEPEAHLYPDAQKYISELLVLFRNAGNSVLITTHSPYVLGAINNLLYAKKIKTRDNTNEINKTVQQDIQLDECRAYFIENGEKTDCIDDELGVISNEVIDGASEEINRTFDRLLKIEGGEE